MRTIAMTCAPLRFASITKTVFCLRPHERERLAAPRKSRTLLGESDSESQAHMNYVTQTRIANDVWAPPLCVSYRDVHLAFASKASHLPLGWPMRKANPCQPCLHEADGMAASPNSV